MPLEKVTDVNYRQLIGSGRAILFFGGEWCGDCKIYFARINGIVERAIQKGIKVGKVEVRRARDPIPHEISGIVMQNYPRGVGRIPRVELYEAGFNIFAFSESHHKRNLTPEYLEKQIRDNFNIKI